MESVSGNLQAQYRKVLVPFDGSAGALKALRRALILAKSSGAEVTVLAVDEGVTRFAPGIGEVAEDDDLQSAFFAEGRQAAVTEAAEHGMTVRVVTAVGHAAQAIVQHAQQNGFEVIVIGHSGHSGLWGSLLGSTTARVVDHATCDVLVVR